MATILAPRVICSMAVDPSGRPCAGEAKPVMLCAWKANENLCDSRPVCCTRRRKDRMSDFFAPVCGAVGGADRSPRKMACIVVKSSLL